jgi:hypothetical protein
MFEVHKPGRPGHGTQAECVAMFEAVMRGELVECNPPVSVEEQRDYLEMARRDRGELEGKNLACWCPPGTPCHADVLLRWLGDQRSRSRNIPGTTSV